MLSRGICIVYLCVSVTTDHSLSPHFFTGWIIFYFFCRGQRLSLTVKLSLSERGTKERKSKSLLFCDKEKKTSRAQGDNLLTLPTPWGPIIYPSLMQSSSWWPCLSRKCYVYFFLLRTNLPLGWVTQNLWAKGKIKTIIFSACFVEPSILLALQKTKKQP